MIVSHVKPESWVDTGEAGKIQPSEVAGLAHVVSLEPEDIELLRGPEGKIGPQGPSGQAGADGAQGPQGPAGPVGEEFLNPKSSAFAIGLGLPAWDATISRIVISGHTGVFVSAHDYWGGVQVFSQSYPGLEGSFRTMSIKGEGVSMRVTPSGGDLRPGEVTIARDSDSLVFAAMGLDGVVKRAVLALT